MAVGSLTLIENQLFLWQSWKCCGEKQSTVCCVSCHFAWQHFFLCQSDRRTVREHSRHWTNRNRHFCWVCHLGTIMNSSNWNISFAALIKCCVFSFPLSPQCRSLPNCCAGSWFPVPWCALSPEQLPAVWSCLVDLQHPLGVQIPYRTFFESCPAASLPWISSQLQPVFCF